MTVLDCLSDNQNFDCTGSPVPSLPLQLLAAANLQHHSRNRHSINLEGNKTALRTHKPIQQLFRVMQMLQHKGRIQNHVLSMEKHGRNQQTDSLIISSRLCQRKRATLLQEFPLHVSHVTCYAFYIWAGFAYRLSNCKLLLHVMNVPVATVINQKRRLSNTHLDAAERQQQSSDYDRKRLSKAVEATLETVYLQSAHPSDEMLQGVFDLHRGVSRRRVIDWLGQRRRMDKAVQNRSARATNFSARQQ